MRAIAPEQPPESSPQHSRMSRFAFSPGSSRPVRCRAAGGRRYRDGPEARRFPDLLEERLPAGARPLSGDSPHRRLRAPEHSNARWGPPGGPTAADPISADRERSGGPVSLAAGAQEQRPPVQKWAGGKRLVGVLPQIRIELLGNTGTEPHPQHPRSTPPHRQRLTQEGGPREPSGTISRAVLRGP